MRRRQGADRQAGFTLVEAMLALALGLFVVGLASLTGLQAARSVRFGALASQMNEEAALALDLLRHQLLLAGFAEPGPDAPSAGAGPFVWGCDRGWGNPNAPLGAIDTCAPAGALQDTVAVAFEADARNSPLLPATGQRAAAPANCSNRAIAAVNGRHPAEHRFQIGTDVDGTPSLQCRGRVGAAWGPPTALVPHIERLRLRYAITRAVQPGAAPPHQVTALVTASALHTAADWARVAAVEVCVLVRSEHPAPAGDVPQHLLTRHRDCDGQPQTATDGRLRRAYRTLVVLPNRRPSVPRPFERRGGDVLNPYRDDDP
jgi:type IV pilus assembly protein PilW